MKIHTKLHNTDDREFLPCGICAKTFKTKDYLKRHTRNVHIEEDQKTCEVCELCGKEFKKLKLMKEHQRRTHGEK